MYWSLCFQKNFYKLLKSVTVFSRISLACDIKCKCAWCTVPCGSDTLFFVYFSTVLYFPSLFVVATSSQYNFNHHYCSLQRWNWVSTNDSSLDTINSILYPFQKIHYKIIFPSTPVYQAGSCSSNVHDLYVGCTLNFIHFSSYPCLVCSVWCSWVSK